MVLAALWFYLLTFIMVLANVMVLSRVMVLVVVMVLAPIMVLPHVMVLTALRCYLLTLFSCPGSSIRDLVGL